MGAKTLFCGGDAALVGNCIICLHAGNKCHEYGFLEGFHHQNQRIFVPRKLNVFFHPNFVIFFIYGTKHHVNAKTILSRQRAIIIYE